jgi:hypothetical protein
MRGAVIATLCAMAAPAAAETPCPTRADLAGGVDLVRLDPYFASAFRETGRGLEEARVVGSGADAQTMTARYLHGLIGTEQDTGAGLFQIVYFEDPAPLDRLPEVERWDSLVNASWNGDFVGEGVYSAIFIETVPFEIGPCTYETWYVQETLVIDTLDPVYVDKYYAPELGLVLGAIVVTEQGEAISNVIYDTVSAH